MIKEYENYHKHDSISNIFTPDTHIKTIDYINRIKELGFMQGIFVEYGITVDDDVTDVRNGGFGSTTK